jgi:hypothetical protein
VRQHHIGENAIMSKQEPVKQQANKPFDLEAAKRGEPIEVLFDEEWIDAKFCSVSDNFTDSIVVEIPLNIRSAKLISPSIWGIANTRMKQTTQDIVMYANVYRLTSGRFSIGSLHETPNEARRNSAGDTSFVAMTQVTFTVTK